MCQFGPVEPPQQVREEPRVPARPGPAPAKRTETAGARDAPDDAREASEAGRAAPCREWQHARRASVQCATRKRRTPRIISRSQTSIIFKYGRLFSVVRVWIGPKSSRARLHPRDLEVGARAQITFTHGFDEAFGPRPGRQKDFLPLSRHVREQHRQPALRRDAMRRVRHVDPENLADPIVDHLDRLLHGKLGRGRRGLADGPADGTLENAVDVLTDEKLVPQPERGQVAFDLGIGLVPLIDRVAGRDFDLPQRGFHR